MDSDTIFYGYRIAFYSVPINSNRVTVYADTDPNPQRGGNRHPQRGDTDHTQRDTDHARAGERLHAHRLPWGLVRGSGGTAGR